MNKDFIEGNWTELKGKVREQWGRLTDDQLDQVQGKWEQLSGVVQQEYGITKDEAEVQIAKFRENNRL
jgi:uncharacterized protein YjbJ (UPF0337 family)